MGERSRRALAFFDRHPRCCFCGGSEEATEIDHVPARILFGSNVRPDQYVFPSCSQCNKRSSTTDVLAAFIFRMCSSIHTDIDVADLKKLAQSMSIVGDDFFREMHLAPSESRRYERQLRRTNKNITVMNMGPIGRCYLSNFGAKIATAHFYKRFGRALPISSDIFSFVFLNTDIEVPSVFPFPFSLDVIETLRQGKLKTERIFEIGSAATTDGNAVAVLSRYYETNYILSAIYISGADPVLIDEMKECHRKPNKLIMEPKNDHVILSTGPIFI